MEMPKTRKRDPGRRWPWLAHPQTGVVHKAWRDRYTGRRERRGYTRSLYQCPHCIFGTFVADLGRQCPNCKAVIVRVETEEETAKRVKRRQKRRERRSPMA